jgi:transcriptional regulator with XRE-family HTH domain
MMANLTAPACKAGRALLGWGVRDLAAKAGLGFDSISAFENGRPMRESNKAKLAEVFEAAGVEILNGDSPGARMRPPRAIPHSTNSFVERGFPNSILHITTALPEQYGQPGFDAQAKQELLQAVAKAVAAEDLQGYKVHWRGA